MLTTITTNNGSTSNNDRNGKKGRGGDDGGGGGRKPEPVYNWKYQAANDGQECIDHTTINLDTNWSKHHQQAWARSKLYGDNLAAWKVKQAE